MSFIIPNAPDTSSTGAAFDVLDQSEPDSIDFQILGNSGRNFVLSGGAVTTANSAITVNVSAATVIIDGVYYTIPAAVPLSVGSGPANKRFDLVVARVVTVGTSASFAVVSGQDNATNPTYPISKAINTTSSDTSITFNEDTDVVLAALYRPASATVTTTRIVDKRVFAKTIVSKQGSSAPTAGTATKGDLYYKNAAAPTGSGTNLYVGGPDNNWTELASNATGVFVPVGAMLGWPSISPIPNGYISADGQALAKAEYVALYAAYGILHGGTSAGSTFNVPNYNGSGLSTSYVPKGTAQGASAVSNSPGQVVGADTQTVTALPTHQHGVAHTHDYVHTHSTGTTGSTAAPISGPTGDGTHGHAAANNTASSVASNMLGSAYSGTYVRTTSTSSTPMVSSDFLAKVAFEVGGAFGAPSVRLSATNTANSAAGTIIITPVNYDTPTITADALHAHSITVGTNDKNHTHPLVSPISGFATGTGQTVGQLPSTLLTDAAGTASPTASVVQASMYVRWIIKSS